jgi:bifunctional UDP-N-acetylglucosamine pyrophosphorylase / glucosamine-1-phosphate N-acetyltransferase
MTQIVILAAGKGTRMGSELPKVLVPLNGRPMIDYLMESVVKAKTTLQPIIVVSPDNKEVISQALANYDVIYAIQDKQLGTGHAVACARPQVSPEAKNILVLYGDHPFVKSSSVKSFLELSPQALTVMPTVLPNFDGWYHNFYAWGRMVRNSQGEVEAITELKDATDKEREITEVNPGFMCFNKEWLFKNIDNLKDNNKAHEFYLTDMVGIAFSEGYKIDTWPIEPREAMGINSPEELNIAENLEKNSTL